MDVGSTDPAHELERNRIAARERRAFDKEHDVPLRRVTTAHLGEDVGFARARATAEKQAG